MQNDIIKLDFSKGLYYRWLENTPPLGERVSRNRSIETLSGDIGIVLFRNDVGIGSRG